ncbi:MAG TPA: tetratricopeptide repeat protein, partial [Chloroflexota bacterium]|nr:tetratricopeptide repeat protein [Chloroflexota bacterium]
PRPGPPDAAAATPPPVAPAPPAPTDSASRGAHTLPASLTSFVGRDRELDEIRQTLGGGPGGDPAPRLVTLTGPGGIGKTRLALQVAALVNAEYADGVWLVDLASVADDALVPQAIAVALEIGEEPDGPLLETLALALQDKRLLLVLDDCERLVGGAAAAVEALLRAAPGVQVLATSRQALGVPGETVWRVPPLRLPPREPPRRPAAPAEGGPDELVRYDAVRLFLERARANRLAFNLTRENAATLVSLCRRLDGLPLALELAAARVRVLSVEQIAARLDDRFRLLTGGSRTAPARQQTLLATVEWSYDLLPGAERRLFGRLSVFAAGWTLGAAEAVCAGEGIDPADVLDLLSQLVDKSLVVVEEEDGGDEVRYRLLETLREYARDRLTGEGPAAGAAVRRRHAAWFLDFAETAALELGGGAQSRWLNRLEAEQDNLRQALRWAVEAGAAATGLRLGVALWRFWNAHSYLTEGREWLGRLLDLPLPPDASPELSRIRGQALTAAGTLAWGQGDYATAQALHQVAREHLAALGDRQGEAAALCGLGQVARLQGDDARARRFYQQSLQIFEQLGDRRGVSIALRELGHIASDEGDRETAREAYAGSLAIALALGDRSGAANANMYLGLLAYHQSDLEAARGAYQESLTIWRELGNRRSTAELLRLLGEVALQAGDLRLASAYHTDSLSLRREVGDRYGVAECLLSLGDDARAAADHARARALYRECLTLYQELGSKRMLAVSLTKLAAALAAGDQPERAARLLGAGEAGLAALGAGVWPADRAMDEATAATLRAALGAAALAAARAAGAALSLDAAVLLGLAEC